MKYYKFYIEPKLKSKNLEYYVIRNERVPDFAIYSFDSGERFEPDFLLFVMKKNIAVDNDFYQAYVEPKGDHLLEQDAWKDKFLGQILDKHKIQTLFVDNYKVLGLPLFNKENRMEDFETYIDKFIEMV